MKESKIGCYSHVTDDWIFVGEKLSQQDLYPERRNVGSEEHFSSLFESTLSPLEAPLFGSDLIFPRHIHRARRIHRSHGGVDEVRLHFDFDFDLIDRLFSFFNP